MRAHLKELFGITISVLALCFAASSSPPEGKLSERYARAILSEKSLAGYWRMEGDLTDKKADTSGVLHGGTARFVEGPGGGKALALGDGQFVIMDKTAHLDLPETTVELFFNITAKPTSNACLFAKRSATQTRFSLHVSKDLTQLLVWNGLAVIPADFPIAPLRVGQWHHLAVTAEKSNLGVYLDGVSCARVAGSSFNFSAKDLPLLIGAATPNGYEQCVCAVDEVVVYSRLLTEDEIGRHLNAIGWAQKKKALLRRKEEILQQKRALEEERRRIRMKMLAERMKDLRLLARGQTRVYRGENLTAISLPLGGIGAGCIQINGKAERPIWQIFNNFNGVFVPDSFFAVRAKALGGQPIVRALQTSPVGPFEAVKSLTFRGEYPFGWYDFQDAGLPVTVGIEVFSPLIPLDARDSAIPCAIFNLTARNTSGKAVEVSFLATQQNAVGFAGDGKIEGRRFGGYGSNRNRVLKENGATILHMTSDRKKNSPSYGDMALAAFQDKVAAAASWDSFDALFEDVSEDGALSGPETAGPSPAGQTLDGALAVPFTLGAGRSRTVRFVLTWHFPNGRHGQGKWGGEGNIYANWWDNAVSVMREVHQRFDELSGLTRLYHDTFYASNLPHWLLDRISSQVAVLRSKTCFWTRDGYFGGWEGCCPGSGCCQGNCAHVWHYAQAHARLFPSIARRMREEALRYQTDDGKIPFRQPGGGTATDGQCGEILEAYREHLCSVDLRWLDKHWPRVRKAMEYVIATWDRDEDGVLSGAQHNTLDCEAGGSTSWLGSLYLSALGASEKMAELQGDSAAAQRYRRIRNTGVTRQNETLWNGDYYIQVPDPQPYRDYNDGCHIDQVLGEWWANQVELDRHYPADRVRSALRSLLKYNFQPNFRGIPQKPRKFVTDDDAGMQMITWPYGPRPDNHTIYADEAMTGFEYAAAAAMVQYALVKEGFTVAKAISDRYDGRLRTGLTATKWASWGYSGNPFGDDECGKFYARAMSVWSLLLASQGFIYDGPAGVIGFKPVWRPQNHATFFTGAEGWGLFTQSRRQKQQSERIEVRYGKLSLKKLIFKLPDDAEPSRVSVNVGGKRINVVHTIKDGSIIVSLPSEVVLRKGEVLTVVVE